MSYQDDEEAAARARLDAEIDQADADSRERAKKDPSIIPVRHSELARRSLERILSKSLEEHEAEWEQKYQHILDKLHALAETNEPLRCANVYRLESELFGAPSSFPIVIRFPDGEILEWLTVHTRSYWEHVRYLRSDCSIDEDVDISAKVEEEMAQETTRFGVNLSVDPLTMEDLQKAVEIWCKHHLPDQSIPRIEWLSGQSAIDLVCEHRAQESGFATYAEYRDFLDQELEESDAVDAEMEEYPKLRLLEMLRAWRERILSVIRRFKR